MINNKVFKASTVSLLTLIYSNKYFYRDIFCYYLAHICHNNV